MLNFLGVGDAFSPSIGNCSAFYKEDNRLILIDCGENIFEKILKYGLLNDVNKLDIIITNFHTDHVGSIGSLLFYLDKIGINDTTIIYPNIKKLDELLHLFGVQKCNYILLNPKLVKNFIIKEIEQIHSIMESYSYLMKINGKNIYYSGDGKNLDKDVLKN